LLKKIHGAEKKWFKHTLSNAELNRFIDEARNGKSGNALVGKISCKTVKKIKWLIGANITKIILESSAVIHAEKNARHQLRKDDIIKRTEVINNPINVIKSSRKNRGSPVLLFEGYINGPLVFVESVHVKHGELSMITAYRKKEAGQGSTGLENPGTYVRNGLPPTPTLSIIQSKIMSTPKLLNTCNFAVISAKRIYA